MTNDQKVLSVLYFVVESDLDQIRQLSRSRIGDLSSNMQFLRDKLKERVSNEQKTPGGQFVSLAERNIIKRTLLDQFEQELLKNKPDLGRKNINQQDSHMERILVDDRLDLPEEDVKALLAKEAPKEEKKKKDKKASKEESKPGEKQKKEKTETAVKSHPGRKIAAGLLILAIVACLGVLGLKFFPQFFQKSQKNEETAQSIEQAKKEEEQKKYDSRQGDVQVVMQFSDIKAPKKISEDTEYYFGTTYSLTMDYTFCNDLQGQDPVTVSLQYADLENHLSKHDYKERKKEEKDRDDIYTFKDDEHVILEKADWIETDDHTAKDYDHDNLVLDWVTIMDSCQNQISSTGDNTDLMPLMPTEQTVTLAGQTFKLVFKTAQGYLMKDESVQDEEGSATNYILVVDAYLVAL